MQTIKCFIVAFLLPFIAIFAHAKTSDFSDGLRISLTQLSEMEFEVKITNSSQIVIPIVEPLYGLATSSLYFILEDSSGAQMVFINKDNIPVPQRERTRGLQNALIKTVILRPGKSYETKVNLDSEYWHWPTTFSLDSILKIRVCYNYPKTKSGYWWSGRISSSPIKWDLPMEFYTAHIMHLYD